MCKFLLLLECLTNGREMSTFFSGQCDSRDLSHYWLPWADNEEIVHHLFSVDEALPLQSDT